MKKVFSCLILLALWLKVATGQFSCPNGIRLVVNELDFQVNIETEEFTFDLSCDPCSYEDGVATCEAERLCKEACADLIPEEADYLQQVAQCELDCAADFPNDPNSYHHCLNYCNDLPYEDHNQCLQSCGSTERVRTIAQSGYAYNFWWSHGFTTSMQGPPDESFVSTPRSGFVGQIVHQSDQNFQNKSISYCYQYEVFVEYQDGTCCRYVGQGCFQKG